MADPPLVTNFNNSMSGQRMNHKDWYDFFPDEDILFKDAKRDDPGATLLVDVAEGESHDTKAFHKRFPDPVGKLILQDLTPAMDNIKQLDDAVV